MSWQPDQLVDLAVTNRLEEEQPLAVTLGPHPPMGQHRGRSSSGPATVAVEEPKLDLRHGGSLRNVTVLMSCNTIAALTATATFLEVQGIGLEQTWESVRLLSRR